MILLNLDSLSCIKKFLVDGGYSGERFANQVKEICGAQVEVVKRNELHKFVVLPRRWVVERLFGWLDKFRRLWKNCERKLFISAQILISALRHDPELLGCAFAPAGAVGAVRWAVKPEGAVLLFAQCPYDKVLGASNLPMLRYEWVWYKSRCSGFLNARRAPLKKSENILVFYRKPPLYDPQFEQGEPYKKIHRRSGNSPNYGKFERTSGESDGRRFPGNVLAFPTVANAVHPTQKPVSLCEYFIRTYTRPGEVVADICAGSGTTAVAAVNTGRRYICFENAPAFYGPAAERVCRAEEAVAQGGKGL